MAILLLIHDDRDFSRELSGIVADLGHSLVCTDTMADGLAAISATEFDIVLMKSRMPEGACIDVLPEIVDSPSYPEVILLSETGDPDEAESAIKSGAWDYIECTHAAAAMRILLVRALQYRSKKVVRKPTDHEFKHSFTGIVGSSPQMKACLELVIQAANSNANTLITGETGTGKELFAMAIHDNSPRAKENFVVVDCASLPETLVESTLFGHEKGAFTGADRPQVGLVTQAHRGTLFLDEVSEVPMAVQASFLRVLQERRFRSVGAANEGVSDFRLIAATNRNLDEMVKQNRFRKDLLYRLRAFTIDLPPIRDRVEDIEEIIRHHLAEICRNYSIDDKEYSPEFLALTSQYDWPGNVREIVNALERAVAAARLEPKLYPQHLPTYIRIRVARAAMGKHDRSTARHGAGRLPALRYVRQTALERAELEYLTELMSLAEGKVEEACRIAGLSRSRLYALLKKHRMGAGR